jgi:hypothetical protein
MGLDSLFQEASVIALQKHDKLSQQMQFKLPLSRRKICNSVLFIFRFLVHDSSEEATELAKKASNFP